MTAGRQNTSTTGVTGTAGAVLITLAAAQFLMTLDSSVMNVSMATVANDLGTSITGIQTAITLYTLVMASLMITGGKIGSMIGRRRAFAIGCVIYGSGSLVTGLAPNLVIMLLGWSLLEGLGAALILPAVVALIAGNFAPADRPRTYGLIAASGAIAVAVGPLLGGAATTYGSWRWVFFGEVAVVVIILLLSKRIADAPVTERARLDLVGTLLSVIGLGTAVFGVLRSSEWGWIIPKSGAPQLLGLSLTFWCVLFGAAVVWLFILWQNHLIARDREPLLRPSMFSNSQLSGGLLLFGFQFMLQAGVFFVIPLFLSVVLELSAIETGLRVMPLSIALLVAAIGVPRIWPDASPRAVVRVGTCLMLLGIVILMSGIDIDADAAVVALPLLCIGLGMGSFSSQLGAVTVSSVPTSQSGEVGGLQNTATNLGASIGTALAGSIMIAALTASLITGIQQNPSVPDQVKERATVTMASGAPFISDTELRSAMEQAGAPTATVDAVVAENRSARIDGLDAALGVLALLATVCLMFTGLLPRRSQHRAEV
jgi:EmrB/QacA subfamily drug resistance transporter